VDSAEKTHENRLRRVAARQGFQLVKSSRRDPLAIGYNRWQITDPRTGTVVAGTGVTGLPSMTLDEVETWLTEPASRKKASR
jgi:hypothetical protein